MKTPGIMHILIVLVFFSLFAESWQLFPVGTTGFTFHDLIAVLMGLFILKELFWDGKTIKLGKSQTRVFYLLFIFAVLLSGAQLPFRGENPQLTQFIKSFAHFLLTSAVMTICMIYPVDNKAWEKTIKLWLYLAIPINIFAVYQIVARAYDLPFAFIEYNNIGLTLRGDYRPEVITQLSLQFESFFRATSIFSEPSALAFFNANVLAFLLAPFSQGIKGVIKSKGLWTIILIVTVVGAFLTFSLSALAAIAVFMSVMVIIEFRRMVKYVAPLVISLAFVVFITDGYVEDYAGISVIDLFSDRITGIVSTERAGTDGESFGIRVQSALNAIDVWLTSPVFGYGLGLTQHSPVSNFVFFDITFLAVLAETGILGGFLFFMIYLSLFFSIFGIYLDNKKFRNNNELDRALLGIIPYILIIMFVFYFAIGNSLIQITMWIQMPLLASVVANYNFKNGRYIEYKIVGRPLKDSFNESLRAFIDAKRSH